MDNENICRECGKKARDLATLHRHLKAHKMSQGNYYVKHFPRYDKLDGSPIEFKNREFYFTADFNSRANLRDWLNRVSINEAKDYVRGMLLARKAKKNLIYTPSQVELRSLPMPGMAYMNGLFGSYYDECKTLGFTNKYWNYKFDGLWVPFSQAHEIRVDTREQMPLSFAGIKTTHEGLDFGDYRLNDDKFSHHCVIERKAIGDFYSTMSGQYFRFCKEIERAQAAGYYVVVLVESPFDSVYDFSRTLKRVDVIISPEYVFHNMRNIIQAYPMVQFLFVEDRQEASDAILRIFQSSGQFKALDLQYAYDIGNLL